MGYYLMIKTIDQNGVKYLCKCMDNKNHILYKGSGVFWRKILKSHPTYTVSTTVLGHYNTKEELSEAGLYYSNLYNVVKDKTWANCIPESGDGGSTTNGKIYGHCPVTLQEKLFDNKDLIPAEWNVGRKPKGPRPQAISEKLLASHLGKKRSEETRMNMKNALRSKRMTVQCTDCNRQITPQNLNRHMEKTHGTKIL